MTLLAAARREGRSLVVTATDSRDEVLAAARLARPAIASTPGLELAIADGRGLPFADGAFDVVTCRIAPHHFPDIRAAVQEMARVSNSLLVIEDNVYRGDEVEEAERLRDPTHVRCYSEDEWKELVTGAGFEVEQVEYFDRRQSFEAWLARVDAAPAATVRIRELLADDIDGEGMVKLRSILLKARKSQR